MSGLGKGWEPVQQQSCISPGKKDRKLLIKVPDDLLAPLLPSLPCLGRGQLLYLCNSLLEPACGSPMASGQRPSPPSCRSPQPESCSSCRQCPGQRQPWWLPVWVDDSHVPPLSSLGSGHQQVLPLCLAAEICPPWWLPSRLSG